MLVGGPYARRELENLFKASLLYLVKMDCYSGIRELCLTDLFSSDSLSVRTGGMLWSPGC